jgi:hypothetical protein
MGVCLKEVEEDQRIKSMYVTWLDLDFIIIIIIIFPDYAQKSSRALIVQHSNVREEPVFSVMVAGWFNFVKSPVALGK